MERDVKMRRSNAGADARTRGPAGAPAMLIALLVAGCGASGPSGEGTAPKLGEAAASPFEVVEGEMPAVAGGDSDTTKVEGDDADIVYCD